MDNQNTQADKIAAMYAGLNQIRGTFEWCKEPRDVFYAKLEAHEAQKALQKERKEKEGKVLREGKIPKKDCKTTKKAIVKATTRQKDPKPSAAPKSKQLAKGDRSYGLGGSRVFRQAKLTARSHKLEKKRLQRIEKAAEELESKQLAKGEHKHGN